MKIKFLGTRGEIRESSNKIYFHSGVLIDDLILIDAGEEHFLDSWPKLILISHLHPDHAFFVRTKSEINIQAPIYAPEKSPWVRKIKIPGSSLRFQDYRISSFPVAHSTKVKSLSFIIKKSKKALLYTGDLIGLEREILNSIGKVNAVITEASYLKRGGMIMKNKQGLAYGHAGVPNLVNLFGNITQRIFFMHYGTWIFKDINEGAKKIRSYSNENLEVIPAFDGDEFYI